MLLFENIRYRGQKRVIVSPESDELDDDDDLDEEYSDEEDDDDGYIDDDSDFDEEPKVTNVHIKKKRKKGYKRLVCLKKVLCCVSLCTCW